MEFTISHSSNQVAMSIIFFRKAIKFQGSDCDDDCIFENYYDVDDILFRLDQEREEEKSTLKEYTDEDITKMPFPKLMDFFKDDEYNLAVL